MQLRTQVESGRMTGNEVESGRRTGNEEEGEKEGKEGGGREGRWK